MQQRIKVPLNKVKQTPINSIIDNQNTTTQALGAQAFYKADKTRKNKIQITTNQLSRMFGVTLMTIYNWRQHRNMPYYHLAGGKKPPVRYDEGLILHWAECHGIPIVHEDYLEM